MLRVLHVGKFFPPHRGGMEVFLADLVAEQQRQGIDAHALVHGDPLPDDPPWLQRVPVQFHLSYAPIALQFRRALRTAIHRLQPDLLHLHLPNNSALWLLTLPGARQIPWVVHWHADVVSSALRRSIALAYRVYRPFEQALLEHTERIITTSPPYLAASAPLHPWHARCAVVPLGLGTGCAPENTIKKARTPYVASASSSINDSTYPAPAPALPWPAGTLRLLSIGRLTYYKGFETLVAAVAGLEAVTLCIVGEGELRAPLQALIAQHHATARIQLLGNVSDAQKTALLQSCDLFCLASRERTEAFGVVLLEAMQQARPCLVADLAGSGMPWIVRSTGAGLLAPPEDVPAWRAAITQLQHDAALRTQLGQAGAQALRTHFGIAACAQGVYAQYALALPDLPPQHPQPPLPRLLIVIPARNEAATIGSLLRSLHAAGWHDVLVINDHSSDDTGAIARAAGAIVLEPTLPIGAWGGMQAGMRYALRRGYQGVITMDADGQHEVAELPTLLQAQAQADVVIGAHPERASHLRQLAWQWFRRLAGFDLRDLTSGFRLYNRAALHVLATREATLLDYQDLGALLLLRRAGLGITEVAVSMNLRSSGKSRIFNSWWSVGKYMAATTLLCLARRGDPPVPPK